MQLSNRLLFVLPLVSLALPSISQAQLRLASDSELERLLAERIDVQRQSIGMVIGIVGPEGRRIVSYGRVAAESKARPDGKTIFDVASVTKVFTGLLLADMALRGEVKLDDPVNVYLDPQAQTKMRGGRSMTLADLATHTSSLSTWPPDLTPLTQTALERYSRQQLLAAASSHQPQRDIGSAWEYSNFGVSLLAAALSHRARSDYESLLRVRVLDPLHMNSTGIEVPGSLQHLRASGHNPQLDPMPAGPAGAFESAGGLKSSANDLLNFLDAAINGSESRLDAAFAEMLRWQRPGPGFAQALGWRVQQIDGHPVIVHDGASFSHAASIAYDPAARVGVVVLSNAAPVVGDISRHILRPSYRLNQGRPVPRRDEIDLDPNTLDKYIGLFRVPTGLTFTVARRENRLTFRAPFSPEMYLRAASDREFFIPELGFNVSFLMDATGTITALQFSALGQPATNAQLVKP